MMQKFGLSGFACALALASVIGFGSADKSLAQVAGENPPIPAVCGFGDLALASTCLFTANGNGLPISARTDFVEDWDSIGYDGLTLAEHELFHAIGFTVAYPLFDNQVFDTPNAGANGIPAGSRVYSTNGLVGGILMVLTPSGDGTHADPAATGAAPWPATGYNQANDIMQPELPKNTVRALNANDFAVLANAFGWNNTGITINVVNVGGTMDAADMAIINQAVAAVNATWASNNTSPVFTWSVDEAVPEPGTWALMLTGAFGLMLVAQRSRRLAG